nr:retrovirus-related Pol polyprotein from transposon TNT 1-94 [Tanacetum cinerariifolium]
MLIFSRTPLFLWAKAIATAYIGKLGAKGDIGFFIGYSADSCAYRVYNRRSKKIMETMNVLFDELSAMAFEQRSSKPRLQWIKHQTSVARTPEQNGVVERHNRTLVEAARTMLSTAKVPLFFWAEAIATSCFTQNCSLIIPRHEKTPYHIINDRKPSVKFFHIFGSLCYIVKDGENLDKMKEKGDACIFVGYSTQSRSYRMASDHDSSDPAPQCQRTALKHDSLSLGPQCQENVPHADG